MLSPDPTNQQPRVGDLYAAQVNDMRTQRAAAVAVLRKHGADEGEILKTEFAALQSMLGNYGATVSEVTAETIVMRAVGNK